MKKNLLILTFLISVTINYSFNQSMTSEPTEYLHYFGPEDVLPLEEAEEIYQKKIIEAPDYFGPDSWGEDIFLEENESE